jgi:hypothetical protein
MTQFVKVILYAAVAVWAVLLFFSGQSVPSAVLRPFSTVTSIVVLLSMAFELWLWKLPLLHGWLVKRPVIDGTWHAEGRWRGSTMLRCTVYTDGVANWPHFVGMTLKTRSSAFCSPR